MEPRYYIGLDAGSTLCKAALFDLQGRQIALARQPTPLDRSRPGWVEADPEACWTACTAVLRQLLAEAGVDLSQIGGLGLSAAMVGLWLVDAQGEALRPGINWEDSRSEDWLAARQAEDPEFLSTIFASSGSVLQQGCTLPVLKWFDQHEPELLDRAAFAFGYKDFLRMKLTGEAGTDFSEAAVTPGCAQTQDRSEAMIALFGLRHRRHLLPSPRPSESAAAGLSAAAAAATGLPEGLPVTVGLGDVPAMVLGAGGMRPGRLTAVLGTTCMLGLCTDQPVFTPKDLGLLFSLPERHWYRAMVNVAGTLNLDWAITTLASDWAALPDRFERVTALIAASPIGAKGAIYLPYLSESGIIAPVVARGARASFANLSPRHDRGDLLRAVFEGVAYAMRDLKTLLSPEAQSLRLTGGGAQNPLWAQMIADVLQIRVEVPAGEEFGARGAALLAAVADGAFASLREATQAVETVAQVYLPQPSQCAGYDQAYARYCQIRDAHLAAL